MRDTTELCANRLVGPDTAFPSPAKRSWAIKVLRGAVALVVLVLLLPVIFWTVNLLKCGHRPIETSDFAAANSYTLPGDGTYTYYPIFSGYACSLNDVRSRHHNTL